jgi:hypothetical protein
MIKHYKEEIIFYVYPKQEDSSRKLSAPKSPSLA